MPYNTLRFILPIHKGLPRAILNRRVVYAGGLKGALVHAILRDYSYMHDFEYKKGISYEC